LLPEGTKALPVAPKRGYAMLRACFDLGWVVDIRGGKRHRHRLVVVFVEAGPLIFVPGLLGEGAWSQPLPLSRRLADHECRRATG